MVNLANFFKYDNTKIIIIIVLSYPNFQARPKNSSVTFTSLISKMAYFSSPNSFKGTGSINTSALNALKAVKKKIKEKCKATYQVNAKAVFGCM